MNADPQPESNEPVPAATATSVSEAVQSGAADAREKASAMVPAIQETVGRAVYGACYYASYAICFPTFLVASFVPKHSALARGMADGAQSAQHSVADLHARRAARRNALAEAQAEQELVVEGTESLAMS